ncbi:MAG: cytochrome C [Candidatus Dactylopiibacterium carminicum]|uniref:Cytochrome C n=2 Tax=Candidatus Dactylopiibacterium carminicum TaxID=857335 RepID=A0A272EYM5_9RHOO|nr:cytochrome C [Candidatus Dactylopiibacterium carminicum]PAS95211.1 MAG: cytochrome C [Candidatus Dactylopiibacterium carminicum]PAS97988.1 MAG: cytochrome C [Candidatus Dactylopiibacterium carminicum]PAT00668.1 MAG: cytochrome C [Candidatus Dactylopiibacterium carminicum]
MKKALFKFMVTVTALHVSAFGSAAEGEATADLVARGRYLAVAGDCMACHTAQGGQPFVGGLAIGTPLGNIYSTNITPAQGSGIGGYTLEDFQRALRQGVRKDGARLYPAMPYVSYATITDEDVAALYAYFMKGVTPVDQRGPQTALPFPFSVRMSMMGWNLLFARQKTFIPDPARSAQWNRGAYLAEGLAHCSTCHTPRNFLMAEKSGAALAGASLGTWFAPNISSDPQAGIGRWSQQDLVSYLTTGHAGNGSQAGGPMLEAINLSFSKMHVEDIEAMGTYIRSVPPQSANAAPGQVPRQPPVLTDFALAAGTSEEGAKLYDAHCATCHQPSGEGTRQLPALYGNAALSRRPNADNLVMALLGGLAPHQGQVMPAFDDVLNDAQVAALTNYLFATLGDAGVSTTANRVAQLREGGTPSSLLAVARVGVGLFAGLVLLVTVAVVMIYRRRRR